MFLKRKMIKDLKTDYRISNNKHCDFVISNNQINYHVLIVNTSKSTQLTINSPKVWEVAKGKIDGIRYRKTSSNLIDLKSYILLENKIVYLTEKPYKILKHLNESDIVDVSDKGIIDGISIVKSLKELKMLLK